MTLRALAALAAVAAALATVSPADGAQIVGVTPNGRSLVLFDTGTPASFQGVPVSGLAVGETIRALDVRPATGQLYALAIKTGSDDAGRLYTVDWATGAATAVGASAFPISPGTGSGDGYGIDFNPVTDRLRVVNSNDANLRVDPERGTISSVDPNLAPPGGEIAAVAHDRSVADATQTTLLAVVTSGNADQLVRIGGVDGVPAADAGSLQTVGPLGRDVSSSASLDVDADGTAYFADGASFGRIAPVSGAYTHSTTLATPIAGFAVLQPSHLTFETKNVTVVESAGVATLTIRRSGPATGTVAVDYVATLESASDADAVAVGGRVVFGPGVTSRTLAIPVRNDGVAEPPETVRVDLSAPSIGATASRTPAVVTIVDPAPPPLPADVTPPSSVVLVQSRLTRDRFRRGVPIQLACFEACVVTVRLRLDSKPVARIQRRIVPNLAASALLPPSPVGRKAVLRVLDRRASVVLELEITVADAAGNEDVVRRALTVTR